MRMSVLCGSRLINALGQCWPVTDGQTDMKELHAACTALFKVAYFSHTLLPVSFLLCVQLELDLSQPPFFKV